MFLHITAHVASPVAQPVSALMSPPLLKPGPGPFWTEDTFKWLVMFFTEVELLILCFFLGKVYNSAAYVNTAILN